MYLYVLMQNVVWLRYFICIVIDLKPNCYHLIWLICFVLIWKFVATFCSIFVVMSLPRRIKCVRLCVINEIMQSHVYVDWYNINKFFVIIVTVTVLYPNPNCCYWLLLHNSYLCYVLLCFEVRSSYFVCNVWVYIELKVCSGYYIFLIR